MTSTIDSNTIARTLIHLLLAIKQQTKDQATTKQQIKVILVNLGLSLDEAVEILRTWGKHQQHFNGLPAGFQAAWMVEEAFVA